MKKDFKNIKTNGGAAMLIAIIFFLFISLAIIAGLVSTTIREFKIVADTVRSKQSFILSESGIEDAYYRLKNAKPIDSPTSLTLNDNTATTVITDSGYNEKTITSLGDVSLRQRKSELILGTGDGFSFNYGMQIGNAATINGSVYVNGDIMGNNSPNITGSAIAADRTTEVINQINDTGTPTDTIQFGTTTSTQDAAQSFTVTTSDVATQVAVYIKKSGTPGKIHVRITTNASGKPAISSLTTGTILATNVTTSYAGP